MLAAVDVPSGHIRWKVDKDGPALANVTATSGGVIFAGDLRGTLYAVKADDGTVLLRHPLPSSVSGGLLTYSVNAKQYVAALSGFVSAFFKGYRHSQTNPAGIALSALAAPRTSQVRKRPPWRTEAMAKLSAAPLQGWHERASEHLGAVRARGNGSSEPTFTALSLTETSAFGSDRHFSLAKIPSATKG